jgi:hypothetical protein
MVNEWGWAEPWARVRVEVGMGEKGKNTVCEQIPQRPTENSETEIPNDG